MLALFLPEGIFGNHLLFLFLTRGNARPKEDFMTGVVWMFYFLLVCRFILRIHELCLSCPVKISSKIGNMFYPKSISNNMLCLCWQQEAKSWLRSWYLTPVTDTGFVNSINLTTINLDSREQPPHFQGNSTSMTIPSRSV